MIFVDSNVPMYLIGAEHPNKAATRRALERCARNREVLVTDAEVLQEILHRYGAIERRDAIEPAFEALLGLVDETFSVHRADVEQAKELLLANPSLSARDSLHLAIMRRQGVRAILSFDRGFDGVEGIERLAE